MIHDYYTRVDLPSSIKSSAIASTFLNCITYPAAREQYNNNKREGLPQA